MFANSVLDVIAVFLLERNMSVQVHSSVMCIYKLVNIYMHW